ncbi:MAG: sugar phosphate isomerase/epimerase family protein [Planctomycetota bacterium]
MVSSAERARRLLDYFRSPRLKIILDPANLFPEGTLGRMREILTNAFELLGPEIALAHAKDLDHDGEAGQLPAGQGVLDYGLYAELLRKIDYRGAIILHGLPEEAVPAALAHLRRHMD